MTDLEVTEFYEKLKDHYGDKLVNFEAYPKQFAFQVKMFRYYEKISVPERTNDASSCSV